MNTKRINYNLFISLGLLVLLFFIFAPIVQAQYWTALPPYNTLWPLWSPALSPVDPVTGLPTPIVNNLSLATILPVQPGLTWDPSFNYPWLLYNTPTGLGYFDQLYGFGMWPPLFATFPLTPSPAWPFLPPTSTNWLQSHVTLSNLLYSFLYDVDPTAFSLLLTPAAILGL